MIYSPPPGSGRLCGVTFRHVTTYSVREESPPAPPGDGPKSSGATAFSCLDWVSAQWNGVGSQGPCPASPRPGTLPGKLTLPLEEGRWESKEREVVGGSGQAVLQGCGCTQGRKGLVTYEGPHQEPFPTQTQLLPLGAIAGAPKPCPSLSLCPPRGNTVIVLGSQRRTWGPAQGEETQATESGLRVGGRGQFTHRGRSRWAQASGRHLELEQGTGRCRASAFSAVKWEHSGLCHRVETTDPITWTGC